MNIQLRLVSLLLMYINKKYIIIIHELPVGRRGKGGRKIIHLTKKDSPTPRQILTQKGQ